VIYKVKQFEGKKKKKKKKIPVSPIPESSSEFRISDTLRWEHESSRGVPVVTRACVGRAKSCTRGINRHCKSAIHTTMKASIRLLQHVPLIKFVGGPHPLCTL
jgi:hypothetical protein